MIYYIYMIYELFNLRTINYCPTMAWFMAKLWCPLALSHMACLLEKSPASTDKDAKSLPANLTWLPHCSIGKSSMNIKWMILRLNVMDDPIHNPFPSIPYVEHPCHPAPKKLGHPDSWVSVPISGSPGCATESKWETLAEDNGPRTTSIVLFQWFIIVWLDLNCANWGVTLW